MQGGRKERKEGEGNLTQGNCLCLYVSLKRRKRWWERMKGAEDYSYWMLVWHPFCGKAIFTVGCANNNPIIMIQSIKPRGGPERD